MGLPYEPIIAPMGLQEEITPTSLADGLRVAHCSPIVRVDRQRGWKFPESDFGTLDFQGSKYAEGVVGWCFAYPKRHGVNHVLRPIALVIGLTALPLAVLAHFKLLEPAEWVKTSDLGDPQKAGPCGLPDTNVDNAKLLTGAST